MGYDGTISAVEMKSTGKIVKDKIDSHTADSNQLSESIEIAV